LASSLELTNATFTIILRSEWREADRNHRLEEWQGLRVQAGILA
jgi:hypothetical protein